MCVFFLSHLCMKNTQCYLHNMSHRADSLDGCCWRSRGKERSCAFSLLFVCLCFYTNAASACILTSITLHCVFQTITNLILLLLFVLCLARSVLPPFLSSTPYCQFLHPPHCPLLPSTLITSSHPTSPLLLYFL